MNISSNYAQSPNFKGFIEVLDTNTHKSDIVNTSVLNVNVKRLPIWGKPADYHGFDNKYIVSYNVCDGLQCYTKEMNPMTKEQLKAFCAKTAYADKSGEIPFIMTGVKEVI